MYGWTEPIPCHQIKITQPAIAGKRVEDILRTDISNFIHLLIIVFPSFTFFFSLSNSFSS